MKNLPFGATLQNLIADRNRPGERKFAPIGTEQVSEDLSYKELVGTCGHVDVTLTASHIFESNVNVRDDERAIANSARIGDAPGHKLAALHLTLKPLNGKDQPSINFSAVRNRKNLWDVTITQGAKVRTMENQSGASIPLENCEITAVTPVYAQLLGRAASAVRSASPVSAGR